MLFLCGTRGHAALPYGKFVTDGPRDKACFALTFDDGPGASTSDILAELAQAHVKATFFMVGGEVKKHPALVKAVSEAGHLIGNHSYTHPNFNKVPAATRVAKLTDEVKRTSDGIQNITGHPTHFLRMPYGVTKQWVLDFARHHQHVVVNWTYGSDWESRPKEELLKEYLSHLNPGSILLMHDGGSKRDTTVWLVHRILAEAQKRHLRPVRVDELLGLEQQPQEPASKPVEEKHPEPAKSKSGKPQQKPQAKAAAQDEEQYEDVDESGMSPSGSGASQSDSGENASADPAQTNAPHKSVQPKAASKPV
jgi:peptidoglycan/xylan/chitin deacetylase (PgdA/CDA1 family)